MLHSLGPHDLALKLENLFAFIGITDRALEQGTLDTIIRGLLPDHRSFTKWLVRRTPAMDREKLDPKEIGDFVIRSSEFVQLSGLFGVFWLIERWASDAGLLLYFSLGKGFDQVCGQFSYRDRIG